MGRVLFLSAVAYLAYRYILRSNQKVLGSGRQSAPGTVEILPPEPGAQITADRPSATESLPPAKSVQRLSAAVESDR